MNHKLLFAACGLILAFSTSCMKKQNLQQEDLGQPFETAALSKVMHDGVGPIDLSMIKPNEFSSYVLTQKIQDGAIYPIEQQDLTVSTITVNSDLFDMNSIVSKITYSGGQSSQSAPRSFNLHQDFHKTQSLTRKSVGAMADLDSPVYLFVEFLVRASDSCLTDIKNPENCYGLTVSDFKYRVPLAANAQHADCAEGEDCYIDARKIEYDTISPNDIDKDGKPRRFHYTYILSQQVPITSRLLQFCRRTLYEVTQAQQKVLVDLCYDINNYAFGNH